MILQRGLKHFIVQPLKTWRHPFYEERFVNSMGRLDVSKVGSPREFFANCSDEYLLWLLANSQRLGYDLCGFVPDLPDEHIQRNWTGGIGEDTMREALYFTQIVRGMMERYSGGLAEDTRILDFGCGWGRVIRFFLRDVDHENLYGSDCYAEALETAKQLNRWCSFALHGTMPPSGFEADQFDLIYLFSVFSHLSEEAHLAWLQEFQRILRPGGMLIATTRSRAFVQRSAQLREQRNVPRQLTGLAASFSDTQSVLQQYDRGAFCHSPTGGGGPLEPSFYGETCIPEMYVRKEWTKWFELLEYRYADRKCSQNVICCIRE